MGVSLEDVESEGGDKRVGPVVRRVSGMIMRVKRLEGLSGLYKGESIVVFLKGRFWGILGQSGGAIKGDKEGRDGSSSVTSTIHLSPLFPARFSTREKQQHPSDLLDGLTF